MANCGVICRWSSNKLAIQTMAMAIKSRVFCALSPLLKMAAECETVDGALGLWRAGLLNRYINYRGRRQADVSCS